MTERLYYAALSSNSYIGSRKFDKIIAQFSSLTDFFALSPAEQMEFLGVKTDKAVPVFTAMRGEGEKIIRCCEDLGITMLTVEDEFFPRKLRDIPDPPYALFYFGNLNLSLPLLAIVGTRSPSHEGETVNRYFSAELASYHLGIVSGLALGHDSLAQQTVLENDGYTVAVLGCGVDVVYPPQNKNLYNMVKERGALLSEYPPGTEPDKWRFPLRNRIISGLSEAVLVIQAPERSGALITARYALEQNKKLFVVPGNPLDKCSAGTNALIREGAQIALKPEDIALEILDNTARKSPIRDLKEIPGLSEEEKQILNAVGEETHIDEIAAGTGLPLARVNAILTKMELSGLVLQYPGRFYARNM